MFFQSKLIIWSFVSYYTVEPLTELSKTFCRQIKYQHKNVLNVFSIKNVEAHKKKLKAFKRCFNFLFAETPFFRVLNKNWFELSLFRIRSFFFKILKNSERKALNLSYACAHEVGSLQSSVALVHVADELGVVFDGTVPVEKQDSKLLGVCCFDSR